MAAQFSPEIEAFIKTYVKDIEAGVARTQPDYRWQCVGRSEWPFAHLGR